MAEQVFTDFVDTMGTAYQAGSQGLRNAAVLQFHFDGAVNAYQEIYDTCDVLDMVQDLQQMTQQASVKQVDWLALKHQINYLSSCQRDLRQRYRSRLDQYRIGSSNRLFDQVVLQNFSNIVDSFQSPG